MSPASMGGYTVVLNQVVKHFRMPTTPRRVRHTHSDPTGPAMPRAAELHTSPPCQDMKRFPGQCLCTSPIILTPQYSHGPGVWNRWVAWGQPNPFRIRREGVPRRLCSREPGTPSSGDIPHLVQTARIAECIPIAGDSCVSPSP